MRPQRIFNFKLLAFNLLLSLLGICFPAPLRAQDIGNVGFRSVSATLANGATCTGSSQVFATSSSALNALGFKNLGQTSHLATATSNAATFTMEIDGIDTLGNVFRLSDLQVGTPTSAKGGLVVTASGYMTNIQVAVVCTSGATFSISYSGSFSPQPPSVAGALLVATDKLPFQTAAANATASTTFQSPSGNSGGTIIFQYSATGPAGSSITAQCVTNSGANLQSFTYPLTTVATPQFFQVSQTNCPFVTLTYTSGGSSAVTYNLEYVFNQSGTQNTLSTANSGPSATSPIQVVSDSVGQAFAASLFASTSSQLGLGGSTTKTTYLDKIIISPGLTSGTANVTVTIFYGGTTTGCSAATSGNLKTNTNVSASAQPITGTACNFTGFSSSFVAFQLFFASTSNQPITIDMRGVIFPPNASYGGMVINTGTFTGNIGISETWYEK